MLDYLKRLVTTGAAYQAADIVSKGIALFTIPLYTSYVSPNGYGTANSLLTAVVLASIFLRLGVGEAFVRFYYHDDDVARRDRIARTATATVAWTTTVAAVLAVVFAAPLSKLLIDVRDPLLLDCATVGLWAFTNIEMAYAQLRVDERARTYLIASASNVGLTVVFTVVLVVFAHQRARGLLLGNFGASAIVVLGLWWVLRRRVSLHVRFADLKAMLRFGLPTVPADASVYALQVADRFYLLRDVRHGSAGVYAVAVQLATVVFVAVRGFQYAWPPLAYSIEDDTQASRLYALVTTYFVLATGIVVCAVALVGRWMVLIAYSSYHSAYLALPWLALAWAMYGLYLVLLVAAGRAGVTSRNLPAAAAGLATNIALLVLLVPHGGAGLGIAGAGIALCGAYLVMLVVMYLLTRRLFPVAFQWRRLTELVVILGGVAVSGELLLPKHGLAGLALRVAWLLLVPVALLAIRFVTPTERAQASALLAQARRRAQAWRAQGGEIEAYEDDPLRDV